jgi:hypothetical protein
MTEVVCTGPTPPEAEKWCTMCSIRFKTEVMDIEEVRAEIDALQHGDGNGKPVHYDLVKAARGRATLPQVAVTISVCMPLNGMLVPLCWGHLQAIKFTSVQPAAGGLLMPPGRPH